MTGYPGGKTMKNKKDLRGVGGWLLFLIVGLTVLGPLLGTGATFGQFSSLETTYPNLKNNTSWSSYKSFSWTVFVVMAIVGFSAGYRLSHEHRPETVRYAVICLWVIGPIKVLIDTLGSAAIFNTSPFASGEPLGQLIGSIIGVGIWILYLKKSVRVKNTYSTWGDTLRERETGIQIVGEESTDPESCSGDLAPKQISADEPLGKKGWWRRRSKNFRLWVFCSVIWASLLILYLIGMEPYGSRMNDRETQEFLFLMLVPPIFIGAVSYGYARFVK